MNVLQADSDVVNVVASHPFDVAFAVSGIDDTVKLFHPCARAVTNDCIQESLASRTSRSHTASSPNSFLLDSDSESVSNEYE